MFYVVLLYIYTVFVNLFYFSLLVVMLVCYILDYVGCSIRRKEKEKHVNMKIYTIPFCYGFSTIISALVHLFFATATIRSFRVDMSAYSSNEEADA